MVTNSDYGINEKFWINNMAILMHHLLQSPKKKQNQFWD